MDAQELTRKTLKMLLRYATKMNNEIDLFAFQKSFNLLVKHFYAGVQNPVERWRGIKQMQIGIEYRKKNCSRIQYTFT